MVHVTRWELTEKPRRKNKAFAARIYQKENGLFITRLEYHYSAPKHGSGYVIQEVTGTKQHAHEVGKMFISELKRGKYDRQIEEDLKREKAYARFGK
jgi:hypothetical protein